MHSALLVCTLTVSLSAAGLNLSAKRFPIEIDGEHYALPYSSSFPIDLPHPGIERIIVAIHGRGSIAPEYLNRVKEAGQDVDSVASKVLIIAPQFLDDGDHKGLPVSDTDLYWTSGVGCWGGLSTTELDHRISSFEVLDRMLSAVTDRALFPRLERIVIAGHSAGGQFVNRYAASSDFEDRVARKAGITVRYIVCNPSSYVYFTAERAVQGTVDRFAVPAGTACGEFNKYGFGPEGLYGYHKTQGGALLQDRYRSRNVIYLVGELDANELDESLTRNCQARLQGRHRLERATIYFNYLQHLYGPELLQDQVLVSIPDVGHSSRQVFRSKQGVAYLFDFPVDPMLDRPNVQSP